MEYITEGARAELIEASNQHYIHGRITYRELLRFKILHHFRRGDLDYAAQLAQLERKEKMKEYTEMTVEELRAQIDSWRAFRAREARGRGPAAAHVRSVVKAEIRDIQAEIRKRGGRSEKHFGPTPYSGKGVGGS